MKYLLLSIFLFISSNSLFGQSISPNHVPGLLRNTQENTIEASLVTEQPQPKGGMSGLYNFISRKMKYPKDTASVIPNGKVYVEFMVDKHGNIPEENIKIARGLHPLLDDEAIRLISIMPKWKPGKDENGKPIDTRMIVSINFQH